jgi:predicted regulator of Ras-like GTPase activity (Roadblock/LC7/MglB family)
MEQIGEMNDVNKATAPKRGFFASLPIFRRNVDSKTAARERGLVVVPTDSTEAAKPLSLKPLTPLWNLDPLDQLAHPAALQALFMTEEKLTLDRVIAMAGQLPGLRACILAHGDQVVCASNTPPGVDLQNLSGQAMTMLAQIRESSSKMGLGNVPGVTLHTDQGAFSFVHNKELCLLVLHSDRGFLPGVRERLQEMLGHLSHAEALPSGPSAQPSLPI